MNPVAKLLHIVHWPLILLSFLALAILGLFVVPCALLFKADMKTFPIWGNREEGYPDWFDRYVQDFWYKKIFPRWWWFCIRNSVNNIRYLFNDTKPFKTDGWQEDVMEAHTLIAAGVTKATRWRYRTFVAGYRKVWLTTYKKDKLRILASIFKLRKVYIPAGTYYGEFWIGWKVGSSVPGMGFTSQFRRNVEIGK